MINHYLRQKLVLLIPIFLLAFHNLMGQLDLPEYEFINTNDGFPKRGITAITTDEQGFIWIGTYGAGLYKYDGTNYTAFNNHFQDTTSLNSNIVNAVYVDKKGQLWVGTDVGLNLYNRVKNQFSTIQFDYQRADDKKKIDIVSIIEDTDGRLLLGSNYYGLFILNPGASTAVKVSFVGERQEPLSFDILNFAISSSGMIYAATNQGLKLFDADKGVLRDAIIHTDSASITLDEPLSSLLIDDLNNLWIGSQHTGMYKTSCLNAKRFSLKYLERFPITQRRILDLTKNKKGHVFCGTENDGLFILNAKGQTLQVLRHNKNTPKGIKSNSIWEVFFDAEERLWLGYYDKGIDVYDPNYRKFNRTSSLTHHANVLSAFSVTGLAIDAKGNIWFSTDGDGLHYWDKENQTFSHYLNEFYPNEIGVAMQTVFIDSKENVWAGSWDEGIFLLKKGEKKFVQFTVKNTNGALTSNRVLSLTEDKYGVIWIGTWGRGIHSYDWRKQKIQYHNSPDLQQYGLENYDIRKVLAEGEELWVGSTRGLFKITLSAEKELNEVVSFQDKWANKFEASSSLNNILSLHKSQSGDLWIGTDGSGLLRYQIQKDSLSRYDYNNGMAQQTVAAIIEASPNQLWISGRSGLSHLNLETGEIKNYSKEDGLISNDFNNNAVLKGENGLLYFGNVVGGINYFQPDSIFTNQSNIKVYLTNLKIFNKTVLPNEENSPLEKNLEVTESITLNYLQSVFTIEYTGINFPKSEKNQFAYYLEGLEDDWNYVGNQRSATYTSLKSGDYTFKVKATNNDGIWTDSPVTLKIKVLPPWWRSNIGFIIYTLLFLLALYIFYRTMRMRVLAKEEVQNERQRREQAQELNNKKIQFFTNISHEFRTPLTLIVNPLEDVLNNQQHDLPDEIHSKHLIIHKNAKRLERLINELMDFRKLSFNKLKVRVRKTEIVRFVHSVAEYFNGEAIGKGIDFTIESKIDSQYVWIDSGLIEKVLFNLLSNAFKVTNADGKISMEVSTTEQIFLEIDKKDPKPALSIAISDTGPGLSAEHVRHIFERFYQVDNLNESYYGGTGIGLEVVSNFVKLHKGKIEVKSELEVGTTFIIYLPIGENYFSDTQLEALPVSAESMEIPILEGTSSPENKATEKTKSLLIVEDNIELQNYLKTELQKLYTVKIASDGSEGLQTAISMLPDLIITDVMMPKVDGFELCKSIKTDIRTCHIPLLMLTAKSNADDQMLGIDSGADAYITKPFNMVLLKAKLHQLLTSRQIIFDKYFSDISESKINKNTTSLDKDFIQKLLGIIHNRIGDTSLSVETLAADIFLSRSQLYRKTKALTGLNVNEFIRKIRLEEAKKLLEQGNVNISEVCYGVGFSSPSYFSKCFKELFGILPTNVGKDKL